MILKIIDKYIIKQFLQTVLFGLLTFTLIFVVIDMMEKLDDFIDANASYSVVLEYYFVFIPEIIRLMLPVAVMLAGLFTVGKLSTQNELTAIKSSGVSFYRFTVPFMVTALLISFIAIYFGGFVVPEANKQRIFIEQNYLKKGLVSSGSNIYFQDTSTRIVTISYFNVKMGKANRISIQEFDNKDVTKMISRIDAISMTYDSANTSWIMNDGVQRYFFGGKDSVNNFKELNIGYLSFTPSEIIQKQKIPDEMTLPELEKYAATQLNAGADPTRVEIEYHSRIAFAFASFVVILFGLTISADKRKGGTAIQFGISVLLTFIYLVFMKVSQAFGKNGVLNPMLTAWAANILFFVAGLFNLIKMKK
ncbi:MAG: LptF/LptG family permease [Ignavibacteriae bacterium]|nr:LptF/LptG family permease [Ignavibacteriota bacterium]